VYADALEASPSRVTDAICLAKSTKFQSYSLAIHRASTTSESISTANRRDLQSWDCKSTSQWLLQSPSKCPIAVRNPQFPIQIVSRAKRQKAAKKPIKKLPTSIEITDKTTVQDVKDNLAKRAGGWDPNRFGLYEPEKKKLLKDRRAIVVQQPEVMSGKEILVKDLGTSSCPNIFERS
jgi:hypothetical protein